ncbi:O-antigen ligase family protein [candidate division WWE3 bacterium]|nr:O-antigen ligase family protein [candidate division WWE3 bacterium]
MLKFLYYLCLFLFGLNQFAILDRTEGGNVNLFDIAVGIFVLVGLLVLLSKKTFFIPRYLAGFLAFSAVAFFSIANRLPELEDFERIFSLLYSVRLLAYLLAGVLVFNMICMKLINEDFVFKSIFCLAFGISAAGFVQLILLPDYRVLDVNLGYDPHINRLGSTFFDPNFAGGLLAFSLSLAIWYLYVAKKTKPTIVNQILWIFVPLTALFLTFSRSSWLMFGVVVFVYGLYKFRLMLVLGVAVAFLAYFAVPRVQTRISGVTDPADSASFRLISWKNAYKIASDNLLAGVGFNAYRHAQKEYGFFETGKYGGSSGSGSDSSFLLALATTGVAGFAVFSFAYFYPVVASLRDYNQLYVVAGLLGLFVHTQFVNSLFYPPMLFVFAVTLAVASPASRT